MPNTLPTGWEISKNKLEIRFIVACDTSDANTKGENRNGFIKTIGIVKKFREEDPGASIDRLEFCLDLVLNMEHVTVKNAYE